MAESVFLLTPIQRIAIETHGNVYVVDEKNKLTPEGIKVPDPLCRHIVAQHLCGVDLGQGKETIWHTDATDLPTLQHPAAAVDVLWLKRSVRCTLLAELFGYYRQIRISGADAKEEEETEYLYSLVVPELESKCHSLRVDECPSASRFVCWLAANLRPLPKMPLVQHLEFVHVQWDGSRPALIGMLQWPSLKSLVLRSSSPPPSGFLAACTGARTCSEVSLLVDCKEETEDPLLPDGLVLVSPGKWVIKDSSERITMVILIICNANK
jgi:hypothetical protein